MKGRKLCIFFCPCGLPNSGKISLNNCEFSHIPPCSWGEPVRNSNRLLLFNCSAEFILVFFEPLLKSAFKLTLVDFSSNFLLLEPFVSLFYCIVSIRFPALKFCHHYSCPFVEENVVSSEMFSCFVLLTTMAASSSSILDLN